MAENYIVSARKYRPATFRTVVGQQALTHTLKTAIASQRLAHAYLFCGPRGVGKTTCARIFAKTINCTNISPDGEACNECESCRAFNEQSSFNIIELDAASNNSVDDIRNLVEKVRIPPQMGRYKVYIIDEVHMLSNSAFNAFLKTLEEPPEYAIFIMATTEKQKVIPTILSRCQIYDFTRITVPDIVKQLQYICQEENVKAEPAALNVIAQKADGAMRDALSIFDQVTASTQGNITYQSAIDNLNILDYDYYFKLVETFLAGDVPQALLIYKEVRDKGFDSLYFINGLAQHLRDLMVASSPQTASLLEMNEEVSQQYVQQAARLQPGFFYRALDLCNTCDLNYRNATSKQLLVELTLVKLCQIMVPTPLPSQPTPDPGIKKIQPATNTTPAPATATTQAPVAQSQPAAPAPATQHAAKPVVAPATPAASTAPQADKGKKTVSRRAKTATPEAAPTDTPATSSVRREPFTADQLLKAWDKYIETHPHEQVIINTMIMSKPVQVDETTYELLVNSQAQLQFMNDNMSKIIAFMHDEMNNDMLTITVKESPVASERKIWTPREVVNNIRERNPKFTQFIKDFELGLA